MTKRPIITRVMPNMDPRNPMSAIAPVATPDEMGGAQFLICRRASDPTPRDADKHIEHLATCGDCGEKIMHRTLPNPDVQLICVYCWVEMKERAK